MSSSKPFHATAISYLFAFIALASPGCAAAQAQAKPDTTKMPSKMPWMNKSLSPDERADMVLGQMTLDEKIQMVHGQGWGVLRAGAPIPPKSNFGAGFMAGIDRLGIPGIDLADSAVGVRMAAYQSRYATLLPSTLGAASSWDPDAAFLYGSVIGRELRAQGFNMSIGGGVDITREPRNGRNFEYAGEDPLLAGTMTGMLEKGVLSEHVMNDIKHYAFNDQETGRNVVNVLLDKKAMRESDLLAFEIAIAIADPSGVMCSYNLVESHYACENDYLLNQVLKRDFKFKGWVLSDWGATHSTVQSALNGLDQDMPGDDNYFSEPLKKAIQDGQVPEARLNDMVHRILRSMFAAGVIDDPPVRTVVDPFRGRDDAQHIAEESIVLLKNSGSILPLKTAASSITLIGSHADVGVLSGGGSAQVDAPGGNAANPQPGGSHWGEAVYFPSSPLKNIQAKSPQASVKYASGDDVAEAVQLAKSSAIAIVFANQPLHEDMDATSLALPGNQNALIDAVAAANPNTIVVLETGGPVSMPWIDHIKGVVEMWYPGIGGAQALANILFGDVNPSGKLPASFAKNDEQLPHPTITGLEGATFTPSGRQHKVKPFDLNYTEGAKVGYKWFEATNKQPIFPFGFGLSYTTYAYSGLTVDDASHTVRFTVRNTGQREGTEIAQVYVALPSAANENYRRLAAFQRVKLAPGQSKEVTLTLNQLCLSVFNTDQNGWQLLPGDYNVMAGPSSSDTALKATLHIHP
ncbi:MAG TPA: glycoside hydrolase family 3 C-terminal domain-containing protein [Edaphobacter sp.]|jgi:beta-glucosidase|nr:glycoside hydrolase family 3 C-terminal domain-containing protein [Edaphobacter sp.]